MSTAQPHQIRALTRLMTIGAELGRFDPPELDEKACHL